MITEAKVENIEGIPKRHDHTQEIILAGIVSIAFLMLFCFTLWIWSGV